MKSHEWGLGGWIVHRPYHYLVKVERLFLEDPQAQVQSQSIYNNNNNNNNISNEIPLVESGKDRVYRDLDTTLCKQMDCFQRTLTRVQPERINNKNNLRSKITRAE